MGIVGCEAASAVHFSPAFCPIVELWACKPGKNCPRWGRFSLATPQARQAPSSIWMQCLRGPVRLPSPHSSALQWRLDLKRRHELRELVLVSASHDRCVGERPAGQF